MVFLSNQIILKKNVLLKNKIKFNHYENSTLILKKIAIIGTVGLPSNYGGFETLTHNITKKLNQKFNFTVYCSSKSYSNKLESFNDCKLHYINLDANGIGSIIYDIRSIIHAQKKSDILLILGVSGCIVLPFIRLISNKKIILNIDGIEWKRQKWGIFAKWFLELSEKIGVRFSNEIIGDNRVIVDYINNRYNKKANLIAYGSDHVTKMKISSLLKKKYSFLSNSYALKVCRIEPENNIEMILKAFSKLSGKDLVLIGNWKKSDFGKKMISMYSCYDNIHMLESIYDQNILNQLRSNCEIYIHGHSAGGTNPSLVEAMFLGLPAFCYDVNFNIETTENSALYFKSSDGLINLIKSISKEEKKQLGNRMEEIAQNRYNWSIISNQYSQLFEKY